LGCGAAADFSFVAAEAANEKKGEDIVMMPSP
jgi:hypothetical protein